MGYFITPKNTTAVLGIPIGRLNFLEREIIALQSQGGGIKFVQPVSGNIDDSNTAFAFSTLPLILVINGLAYRQSGGAITWSYAGGIVILSSPVGVNGSLFALSGTYTIIEIPGTISDNNVSFSSAVEPLYLVMNGAAYLRSGALITWTYLNGAIVTNEPVGSGGCLFGLSGVALSADTNGIITGIQ
jgi:hypothetical protein